MPQDHEGRRQVLRLLQPAPGREERTEGYFEAAVFDEGSAREPAAQRGRPHRQEGRHRCGVEVAEEAPARARNRVPPGARSDAGFHRRSGRGRSRGDAQRDAEPRRRCREDQSAGAGRSRHRPLGHRQLLR